MSGFTIEELAVPATLDGPGADDFVDAVRVGNEVWTDAFGTPEELKRNGKKIKGKVSFHWIETGDHGFKPLKSSGVTPAAALDGVAQAVVEFVTGLPAAK